MLGAILHRLVNGAPMNVSEAVERRISVRAYTDQPVSAAMVAEILNRAARAPSGGNLQPWRFYSLAGEPLKAMVADVA